MASCASQLFYGLCVQTSDLIAAARAFPKLDGPTRALDLIQLRRAKGTLKTKFGLRRGSVKRVPAEVWELVRQALVDVEVELSRRALVDRQRCLDCGDPVHARSSGPAEVDVWDQKWIDALDKLSDGTLAEEKSCRCEWHYYCRWAAHDDDVYDLLDSFGLRLVPSSAAPISPRHERRSVHSTAIKVSFGAYVSVDTDLVDISDASTLVLIPDDAFKLPKNADLRFSKFLKAFTVSSVQPFAQRDHQEAAEEEGEKEKKDEGEKGLAKGKGKEKAEGKAKAGGLCQCAPRPRWLLSSKFTADEDNSEYEF